MATINGKTLNSLIRHYRDDQDDLDMIIKTLEAFEDYHWAIYHMEITRRLSSCDAIDPDTYRTETEQRDRTRTVNHNAVIAQVGILNRMAEEAKLPPFYDGVVSKEHPYRRELADAVLVFVREVMVNRV